MLTRYQLESALNDARVTSFLNVLGDSEGTGARYDILFAGRTFSSWARHPGTINGHSAAGRYQFLSSTWAGLQAQYGFSDFGPHNQDLGAVALLNDCGALGRLLSNDFAGAVNAARFTWPSLPGGSQQTRTFAQSAAVYNRTLGSAGARPGGINLTQGGINLTPLVLDPNYGYLPTQTSNIDLFGGTPPAFSSGSNNQTLLLLAVVAAFLLL
jgi:muramidase (phage lysozyme)